MNRVLIAAAVGAAVGIVGTIVVNRIAGTPPIDAQQTIVRDIGEVPKMSATAAAVHRETRYEKLQTVSQVLALPSGFSQTEALYVLAGRSDSGTVQHLLYEANRIDHDDRRKNALRILFSRLAELDPRSALALARNGVFSNGPEIESEVWQNWARDDLDAALEAVSGEANVAKRHLAVQALYAAHGFLGSDITGRIEAETGIPPGRSVREQYLYRLADRSVGDAIAWIREQTSERNRQQNTYWLGQYLSTNDPVGAASYADRFDDEELARWYRSSIDGVQAAARPEETLARLLNGPADEAQEGQIQRAIYELASRDVDAAIRFFESAQSSRYRHNFGYLIVQELAQQDPTRALQWAEENDHTGQFQLVAQALGVVAKSDPQRALTHASEIKHPQRRRRAMSSVISSIADREPQLAASYIDQIDSPQEQVSAAWRVAARWIRDDPLAAIRWLENSDGFDGAMVLQQTASVLAQTDLDKAIDVLPHLREEHAAGWRKQIAEHLAQQRSPAEAMEFIRAYEGSEYYDSLHAAVAGGIAEHDVAAARQLADQLPAGPSRDRAYAQLVTQHANTNPREAASWLATIGNDAQRVAATGALARAWQARDAEAATLWADKLPRGTARDTAIVSQIYGWLELTPSRRLLIDSIGDAERKTQAWAAQVNVIARGDPDTATRLLHELNLPTEQREKVEAVIAQSSTFYLR